METALLFDGKGRQLSLFFKECLTTAESLQLRVHGTLNTATGACDCIASLSKILFWRPLLDNRRSSAAYLRNKTRSKLQAGLTYVSRSDDLLCSLTAKHQLPIADSGAFLTAKLTADCNTQTQEAMHKITAFADQVFGLGDFRFSKTIYNFSDRQDIRLAVGTRGHFDERSAIRWEPYGELRENNWSLNTNFAGWWGVKYDL